MRTELQSAIAGLAAVHDVVFDIGGHSFHTPHPEIRRLVSESLELFEQRRDARCFSHGRLIAYPFQKHFRELSDAAVVQECAAGLQAARPESGARHFGEFLEQRFGAGIARHFMLPYNRKLWGRDLARRLPNVRYNQDVVGVDATARVVRTAVGRSYRYRTLVSTLPLPGFCGSAGAPEELQRQVDSLNYLSLKVILLVLNHPVDTDIQRIYCADDTVPAHKIALNHNSSDYLRAQPRHGVMAEVSCAQGALPSDRKLTRATISGLRRMGIRPRRALAAGRKRSPHGRHRAGPTAASARGGLARRARGARAAPDRAPGERTC